MEIDKILYQIETGDISLPEFQREYVWSKDQAKQLLVSLFNEYPTGSLLFWDTDNPPKLKNKKVHDHKQGLVKVILDGQQRLTTLYLFIKNKIPPYYTGKDIEHDPRDLWFNLETGEFRYYQKTLMQNNPLWRKTVDCFDEHMNPIQVVQDATGKLEEKLLIKVNENLNKIKRIKRQDYPIQIVQNHTSIDGAIDVFDKINSQGTPLSDAELVLAHIAGKWPDVRRKVKNKSQQLKNKNFVFSLDFFTRCIVVALTNSAIYKSMTSKVYKETTADDYKNAWERVSKKIDYLLPILKQKAFIDSSSELITNNVLIPIIAYLLKHNNFKNEKIKRGFLYWMFLALIWGRYSGQTDQKLDKDVFLSTSKESQIQKLLDEIKDQRGRLNVKPLDLEGRSAGHPLHRMLYIITKWNNAIDWADGGSLRDTMGDYFSIQSHHIFPQSLLYKNGYDSENHLDVKKVNEVANRAFITRDANYYISNKPPSLYFKKISKEKLEKQFIPMDEINWKLQNYEQFLQMRRVLIANIMNTFLKELKGEEIVAEGKIDYLHMIKEGESNFVEFKSSMHWDYHQDKINKDLEIVLAKTISAFMNSQGGTLFIGVNDNGEVLGIEKDYKTFGKRQNKDGFSQKLTQIINYYIGPNFSPLVMPEFILINGKEICVLKIPEGTQPIYMKKKEKEENFFVRAASCSQPLSMREAHDYIKDHW